MPDPSNYASEDAFMDACIPMAMNEGHDRDQAIAMCAQMWRDKAAAPVIVKLDGPIPIVKAEDVIDRRAWSVLTVKSVNAERREIEGIATTPSVDRIGDIVEPLGAKFTLPMPLLHHHDSKSPVGNVIAAKAGKDGITIKAKLARETEPGPLKDRLDTAWQELKHGLVRGLSIGFKALEYEPLKDGGGLRFTKWAWHELSLVTIPANTDASISLVKSLDTDLRNGIESDAGTVPASPGASGKSSATLTAVGTVPAAPGLGKSKATVKITGSKSMAMTTSEAIAASEAARQAKAARMAALMEEVTAKGETLDAEQAQEYEDLKSEVKTLDEHLIRLQDLARIQMATAKPVETVKSPQEASDVRAGHAIRVQGVKLPPGIAFSRVVRCIAQTNGDYDRSIMLAEKSYPDHPEIAAALRLKAAVAAGTTTESVWAGALVSAEGAPFADFLDFLRPQTILGKFGTNGIPSLDRVPFRVPLGSQTSGGAGYWVGESQAKPLTKFDFARTTLLPLKVANICVVSKELIKYSGIAVETRLRNELAQALRARMDVDFIDPASAATQFRPAAITNGATLVTSAGASADSVRADINATMQVFLSANNPPETGVWIMSPNTAQAVALMSNAFGQQEEFARGISVNGGTFAGLPVITSNHVGEAGSPLGKYVWLVNARDVWIAEEGLDVAMSSEASLEMSDAPVHAAGGIGSPEASGGTSLVSMFQTNSVALLAEMVVNWARARTTAVVGITGVTWGQ